MQARMTGQYFIHDGTGTTPYYTQPIRRGGLGGTASIDVTHVGGSPTVVITLEQKNDGETTWGVLAAFSDITAVGVETVNFSNPDELIRFAITMSAGNLADFIATRGLQVVFRPSA